MFDKLWSRRELLAFAGGTVLTALTGATRASQASAPDGAKRSAYEQAVLESGPAAYWRLGESHGRTAEDAAGNGLNGRYVGHPDLGQNGALCRIPTRRSAWAGRRQTPTWRSRTATISA